MNDLVKASKKKIKQIKPIMAYVPSDKVLEILHRFVDEINDLTIIKPS